MKLILKYMFIALLLASCISSADKYESVSIHSELETLIKQLEDKPLDKKINSIIIEKLFGNTNMNLLEKYAFKLAYFNNLNSEDDFNKLYSYLEKNNDYSDLIKLVNNANKSNISNVSWKSLVELELMQDYYTDADKIFYIQKKLKILIF